MLIVKISAINFIVIFIINIKIIVDIITIMVIIEKVYILGLFIQ